MSKFLCLMLLIALAACSPGESLAPLPTVANIPTQAPPTETAATTPLPTIPTETRTPSPIPPTITNTPDARKWTVNTDVSAIDDTKNMTLFLSAESEVQGRLFSNTPTLIIRCKQNQIDVYINLGMQIDGDADPTRVRVRWDKDEPISQQMNRSTDNEALFFIDPNNAIDNMQKHDTMAFEFTPFEAAPTDTTFDLRGLSTVIQPLFDACQQT